jgi:hypothetical protein
MSPFGRRNFLRGAAGLLVALPTLESLGCSRGSGGEGTASQGAALSTDKRLVMMFTPYGGATDTSFFPVGGTETSFTLPYQLAPLAPHQKDLLLLQEIDLIPFIKNGQNAVGHGAPYCYVVGGVPIFQGDQTPGAGGISLDQKIAQVIGKDTPLRSLALNVGNSSQYVTSTIAYTGPMQPVPALRDPVAAFNKVFQGFNVPPDKLKAIHDERKSVLDFVLDDYTSVRGQVSGSDQKTIDYHLQSIRDLETRLDNLQANQAVCQVPTLNNPPRDLGTWQQGSGKDFVAIADFHMDLISLAFACNVTRVATFTWEGDVSFDATLKGLEPDMTSVGQSHTASHEDQAKFAKIVNWYSKKHAAFIQKLKDRKVFDNCLFMSFSENGTAPGGHSPYDMPYVLAGNAGGAFKTGRHIKCGHRSPNDLYIAIQNAFGVADTKFGDPGSCTGPLTAINA